MAFTRSTDGAAARPTLAILAALAATGVAPASAGESERLREALAAREKAQVERALGTDATEGTEPKIIGGTPAPNGAWPFMAAIVSASDPVDWSAQFCGASVIGDQWILTAAHCVEDVIAPSDIAIVVGTQTLSQTSTSSGTRYAVDSISVHPNWNPSTYDYDVAVLHLASAIPSPSTVKLLTASQGGLADPADAATVIGWGDTDQSSATSYPTALYQVTVPIVAQAKCNGKKSYKGAITDRMLCAGPKKGGKDSCQGDSGGPLLVEDTTIPATDWYQAGIVSWGKGCARKKFPGVYTRVTVVEPWVTGVVTGTVALTSARSCDAAPAAERSACYDRALAEAEGRAAAFRAVLTARSGAARKSALEVGEAAWRASLTGVCRFAETSGGSTGRKRCVAEETERRVQALAGMTAALGTAGAP